jgi:hypothetical protein
MSKPATHIIVKYPSKGMDLLYRASDGMAIACRNQITVIAGVDPNPTKMAHRNFLDEKFASAYLHHLADIDQNFGAPDEDRIAPRETLQYAASVEERFGESRIVTPTN